MKPSFSLKNAWDYSIMNCNFPNPDKQESKAEAKEKGISRKAAKDAKEIFKFWFVKPKDMSFLCELGISFKSAYFWLRENSLPF